MGEHEMTDTLIDLITGHLEGRERKQVEQHLTSCEACRDEYAHLLRVWVELGSYSTKSPAGLQAIFAERIYSEIGGSGGRADGAHKASDIGGASPVKRRAMAALRTAALLLLGAALGVMGTRFPRRESGSEGISRSISRDGETLQRFMVVLLQRPGMYDSLSEQERSGIMGAYLAWGRELQEAGRYAGTRGLAAAEGLILDMQDGSLLVRDLPPTDQFEVITGFYEIWATDYDDAVRLTRECPNLRYGGEVEVREVVIIG